MEHRLISTNQVVLLGVVKSVFIHIVRGEVQFLTGADRKRRAGCTHTECFGSVHESGRTALLREAFQ